MGREIRMDVVYPHPPATVWSAVTTSEAIAAWLMPNDFEARVGHRFTLQAEPAPGFDGIVRCEVLEIDPGRLLRFSWKGGPIDTVVSFELQPDPKGTRFRMLQTGFKGFQAVLVSFILAAGSRRIYREHLPRTLRRMQDDGTLADAPSADGAKDCDDRGGFWRFLAFLFSPFLNSKDRE